MSFAETLFEGVSPANLALAKSLAQETQTEDKDLWPWFATFYFNPNVKSPEMSIKTIIREVVRKKIGFDPEATDSHPRLDSDVIGVYDIHDKQIKRIRLGESEEAKLIFDLIGKPVYKAYDWDQITIWKLGNMEELMAQTGNKEYLALPETGAVLFSDEIKKLRSGETLETFHGAGIEGYLMELREVYKIIDNELMRIVARFSD